MPKKTATPYTVSYCDSIPRGKEIAGLTHRGAWAKLAPRLKKKKAGRRGRPSGLWMLRDFGASIVGQYTDLSPPVNSRFRRIRSVQRLILFPPPEAF